MPRHDYKCELCGYVTEIAFPTADQMEQWDGHILCGNCEDGRMIRQPAAPNFTIKGYAASNGYTRKS